MRKSIAPPWTTLGKHIESATRKALYDHHLIPDDGKIAVALSGGKDSLTLLSMLKAISGRGFVDFSLCAIHVSGTYSCGPAISDKYLKKICDELNVELIIVDSELSDTEKLSCYPCSRNRRRLLFNKAKEIGYSVVAFGHHRDDSIETLLMNLFHKGEFAANLPLVAMQDYGITIIRPLIYVEEEKIQRFADHHGFSRIVCQCPVGAKSKRRDVKDLISYIEVKFPHLRNNLALASLVYGSDKASRK